MDNKEPCTRSGCHDGDGLAYVLLMLCYIGLVAIIIFTIPYIITFIAIKTNNPNLMKVGICLNCLMLVF